MKMIEKKVAPTKIETADEKNDIKTVKAELRREKTLRYILRMIRRCWKVGLDAAKLQGPEEYKICKARYEEFRQDFLIEHPEAENIFTSKI